LNHRGGEVETSELLNHVEPTRVEGVDLYHLPSDNIDASEPDAVSAEVGCESVNQRVILRGDLARFRLTALFEVVPELTWSSPPEVTAEQAPVQPHEALLALLGGDEVLLGDDVAVSGVSGAVEGLLQRGWGSGAGRAGCLGHQRPGRA
jgi:hypothetical protein